MQDTCILHQKHFHAHCDVISDEYITDKVQNHGGEQYSFSSMIKFTTFGKEQCHSTIYEHWYLSVKNTQVHDGTLNVIMAIKQCGSRRNWCKLAHSAFEVLIIAMPSCVNLELVIFMVPFYRLNVFHNTSTSILKERHLNYFINTRN